MHGDGAVTSLPVQVIQEAEDSVFVRTDLPEGSRVVVSDLAVMTEGMEVKVLEGTDR